MAISVINTSDLLDRYFPNAEILLSASASQLAVIRCKLCGGHAKVNRYMLEHSGYIEDASRIYGRSHTWECNKRHTQWMAQQNSTKYLNQPFQNTPLGNGEFNESGTIQTYIERRVNELNGRCQYLEDTLVHVRICAEQLKHENDSLKQEMAQLHKQYQAIHSQIASILCSSISPSADGIYNAMSQFMA